MSFEEGRVLLINKPLQWTSFDVVNNLRNQLKVKKIGHAGTLDPLATGLLILCTGKFTKQIDNFQNLEKEYTGTFVVGQTTASHDLETEVTEAVPVGHLTLEILEICRKKFVGTISQIPPMHSAIRIMGKRAYEFARKGVEKKLEPREVSISEFEWDVNLPEIYFKVVCSKGTYIRSLARDIGNELGVGAYLSNLCRTRIGDFKLKNAQSIDEVIAEYQKTRD